MELSTLALALCLVAVVFMLAIRRAYLIINESRDPETRRRHWRAASPFGTVNLGRSIDYATALERASKLGTVSFTDMEHGVIFYNTDLGIASGGPSN